MYEVDTDELFSASRSLGGCAVFFTSLRRRLLAAQDCNAIRTASYRSVNHAIDAMVDSFSIAVQDIESLEDAIQAIGRAYATAEDEMRVFGLSALRSDISGHPETRPRAASYEGYSNNAFIGSDSRSYGGGGFRDYTASSDNDFENEFAKWFTDIVSKYVDGDYGDGAGVLNGMLEYFDSLSLALGFEGYEKGGISELLDLAKDSTGLWKELYDASVNVYGIKGMNGPGLFTQNAQNIVGALPVGMSIVGFASGLAEMSDKGYASAAEVINDALTKLGGSAVDVAKAILSYGDQAKGAYTPAAQWAVLAKTGLASVGQVGKSIEKYSADGVWDTTDTAATGIEMGVSGLYAMADGLSFGLLKNVIKVTPDDISQGLEDWGEKAGQWLAKKSIEGGWSWVFGG